ncbi:hypothetical protein ABTN41_19730, partial [Acinetobacter baumannii]
IFNNGVLGFVALEMKAAGFVDLGTAFENPDFAATANAMGILGIRSRKVRDSTSHDNCVCGVCARWMIVPRRSRWIRSQAVTPTRATCS